MNELPMYVVKMKYYLDMRGNSNCIENEMHFLLECPLYNNLRRDMTDQIKKYPSLDNLNRKDLFSWIMINEDSRFLSILCAYLDKGLQLRNQKIS